jgi:chromosome segregation ATPase
MNKSNTINKHSRILYFATIKQGKNEISVYPIQETTIRFRSIKSAVKRLELLGKKGLYGQGRVYEVTSMKLVFTIAL